MEGIPTTEEKNSHQPLAVRDIPVGFLEWISVQYSKTTQVPAVFVGHSYLLLIVCIFGQLANSF